MKTNYYELRTRKIDRLCEELDKELDKLWVYDFYIKSYPIDIARITEGWKAVLYYNNGRYYKNWEEMKEWLRGLKGAFIMDMEKHIITVEEFIRIVEESQKGKEQSCDEDYIIINGYVFYDDD